MFTDWYHEKWLSGIWAVNYLKFQMKQSYDNVCFVLSKPGERLKIDFIELKMGEGLLVEWIVSFHALYQ